MRKIFINSILIINFYLILFFWFNNSNYLINGNGGSDLFIAFGRLAGLLSQLLILILLFLISRFSYIEKEYGFDKLIGMHKKIGFFLSIFLILHPILLTIGYAQSNNVPYFAQFLNFLTKWEEIAGATVALVVIIFVAFISIKKYRKNIPYEIWYFLHLPLYIVVAIAFEHQISTGDMVSGGALYYWFLINIITLGALILFRILKPIYLFFKYSFVVEKIVKENNNIYSIYITGKNIDLYKFQGGQYANLIFLQNMMWFHHPFSYSDAYNGKYLRFSIKASGDFTSKIEKLMVGTHVFIEGPLGKFTLKNSINNEYVFIAGGIGITPILSIIKSMKDKSGGILFYSNKTEEEIIFKKEIAESNIEAYYFNTSQDKNNRINIEKIVNMCPNFMERDYFICGPVQMTTNLVKQLKNTGVSAEQIHFEKFDY